MNVEEKKYMRISGRTNRVRDFMERKEHSENQKIDTMLKEK